MTLTLPSNLLRLALIADAAASGATGLLMFAGAGMLTELLGLPAGLLRYAGLALLPFALFVAYVGTRGDIPRGAAGTIVAVNFAWALASVALLAGGWLSPTLLGYAFVLVQAVTVAILAELQWIGVRRPAARPAAE